MNKTIPAFFEDVASEIPLALAIIHGDKCLTYQELNKQSNQLAHFIHPKIIREKMPMVALFFDKGFDMIISILGIWKSGAAYIPIDPTYPNDRIKFILKDTNASMVLSSSDYVLRLKTLIDSEKEIIAFDEMDLNPLPNQNLNLPFNNNPYAYIIYTSGSTGTPKGILKTHKSVVNCTEVISKQYKINKNNKEIIALFSNYVYEPFLRQMLVALLNGQTLVIVRDEIKCNPKQFTNFLNQNNITFLNGTASLLKEYDYTECKTLKKLVFAGEELTESCYNRVRKSFNRVIINEYGPTECTFVSCLKIYQNCEVRDNRSIGKPIENVKCYVLDEKMKKVPSGIIGELYISGIGVSEGYFNLPKQTAERFHKNLFQTKTEKTQGIYDKIYNTGDLAKWLPNGELEFLGRNDFQIKINGIRIEPGEIEATLLNHSLIENAIVVSNLALKLQMEEKFLIGFFISKENITEEILKSFLSSKLPIYMVPKRIIQILEIPKTISGKIDFSEMSKIYQEAVEILLANINRKNFDELMQDEKDGIEKVLKEILANLLHTSTNFIDDERDIFQIGADSITIIRLISEIRTKLAIELTVTEIYENSKIKMLTKVCKSYHNSKICNSNPKINADESENIFPANNMQQQFLYNSMKTNDDTYVIQYKCEYETKLNPKIYKKAWKLTLSKFPSLRLKFLIKKDEIYQIIAEKQKLEWKFIDLSNSKNYFEESKFIQENDRKKLYNLEAGNLFRIYLLKINESKFYLIFSCHHIILDGWSFAVLFNFVHDSYLKVLNGKDVFVTEDFAYKNAQKFLNKKNEKSLMNNNYFENENERPDINGLLKDDKKNKINISQRNHIICQQEVSLKVNSETYTKLENELKDYGITYNSILQFCWTKLLSFYGNCKQISLGTVISGRNIPLSNIMNSVGLYISTLPLMINFEELDKLQLSDAIKNLQSKVFEINDGSKSYNSKKYEFDSMFVFENYQSLKNAKDSTEAEKELNFKVLSTFEKLDFPLTFIVTKPENSLQIKIVFDEDLFEQETMEQLLKNMHELLKKITFNLDSTINDFEVLSTEQEKILNSWNENSKIEYSLNQTLHGIFENKVEENSHKIAVVYENEKLSYKELNKNANQVAHYLRQTNLIKPNSIIALFLDKSNLMIISILGIWKSGAAYVPIDPSYPNDRIKFILKDTNASIIITNGIYISKLQKFISSEILIIEAEKYCNGNLAEIDCENLLNMSESRDLAYVIYTSGTTGNPKGVMVEHRGVVNLCFALRDIFDLQNEKPETILSFSNYVFDHFIEQMLDALINGQTLVILNDEMRVDKKRLYDYISKNDVTYLSGTPSVLKMYNYDEFDSASLTRIDAVGEDFSETVFNEIRRMFKGLIINGYGPTEVSITTHKKLYNLNEIRSNKSIGKQIANISCYVLDENLHRIPIGAVGELYLGGIGVARGYLNRPDLTAERFLLNPFQTEEEKIKNENERIYKTGDLVRFLSNGEMEFLGRNDFQVKINGSRVELGEIETALSLYPKIKQCIVIAKDITTKICSTTSKKYLIGYYISDSKICEQDIKTFLRNKLPSHMIPNRLCQIDKIPVTISGKLDSKNLPDIEYSANLDTYIPPKNDLEKKLCKIWSEILEIPVEEIGIEDDFFNLGGDSIMSVKLYFTISHEFSINVNSNIFKYRTIKNMKEFIEGNQKENISKHLIPAKNQQESCLSFSQERILFIEQFEGGTNAYNVCMHYFTSVGVNIKSLKEAFLKVIERQDVLRTIIIKNSENQQFFQKVLEFQTAKDMFEINKINVENEFVLKTAMKNAENYHFNLQKYLPIQVSCYFINNQCKHLTINIHHIYFDKWSQNILERELQYYYCKFLNDINEVERFPKIDITYRDYSVWERNEMKDEKVDKQIKYWRKKFEKFEALNLPMDYKRPTNFDYQAGCEIFFELDEERTTLLKELAKQLKVTLYSILIGTYCIMLSNFAHQKSLIIGTAVTTRTQSELENLIGLFVNMLPLNIQQNPTQKLCNYFQMVNNEILEAQNSQNIPFEKLVKEFSEKQILSQHPIFQVVFNMEDNTKFKSENIDNFMVPFNPCELESNVTTKYDLLASIRKTHPKIEGYFNYYTKIFHSSTIKNMIESYIFLLEQLAKNVKNGNLLNLENKSLKLANPNHELILSSLKKENYMETKNTELTLNQIFDKIVEKHPTKSALRFGTCNLTYKELNKNANQVAHYLQQTNLIKPKNSIIALFLDKSSLMIISILGIWKSGAAYVPIDPSYPNDRINFILKDTNVSIIITNGIYISKLQKFISSEILIIEAEKYCTGNSEANLIYPLQNANITANNLAYVIYTSGSTGNPKGVMVEHRNVISFFTDISQRYFKSSSDEGILFLSNYAFDFSIEQFVLSFLSGKKLIIVPENIRIGSIDFYKYLTQSSVTYISGTPSQLQLINFKKLPTLKQITVAGELFQKFHFEYIRQGFNGLLINAYGTTETTVYNFIQVFAKNDKFINSLGKPLNNTKMYVLNESLKEVPPNAIGKLFLSGECVTRGYLNRLNENSKSFIKFKEKNDSENVLYNTGDLVRWSKDGNLEYIGRDDFQVKINGVRIDLSEIKNTVLNFENIQECAVIVDEKCLKQKQIIVYYVSTNNENIDKKNLFNFLNLQLPSFMIPNKIIQIFEHLPLTSNGKLDERVLSKLNCINLNENGPIFTPPTNYLEEKLCQIWANLLNLSKIGINDDFFALGGDSILVMQLAEQIYNDLQINVSLKDIFIHRCIKNLAAILQIQKPEIKKEITDLKIVNGKSDFYPLLPIQKWFFEKNLKNLHHWNQTFTIKIQKEIDFGKLQKALIKLFQLHEAFRLRFKKTESGHLQYYTSMDSIKDFKLKCLSIKKLGIQKVNKIIENSQANLNIYNGPLFFVYYLNEFENNHETLKIIFSMHHLIVDVVSWRIICRDLERIYNNDAINRSSMTSYLKWVHILNCYYLNNEMENEKEWWKKLIEKCSKYNQTLLNKINFSKEHQKYNFSISVEQTECILRYSIQKFQIKSVNTILLAALGHSLHSLTGQKNNYITMEGHGRESDCLKDSNININNTIGWFTTMYPFEILSTENLKEEIENIKNFEANIPNNGIGFGCIFGYKNLPKICFNYLGQLDKFNKLNNSSWEIADFDSDYNCRNDTTESTLSSNKNVIDLCAFVTNGKMEFRISSKFETSKTEEFINNFKKTFDEILYICKNENPKNDSIFNPYFEFHKEKTDTIFVLPPGEGGAESYSRIIHKFSNFHMILFNNYYLYCKQNYEKNDLTFEILAKFYIKYVKFLQPKGPYTFIGWSFGGVLSFEITRQLINEGQAVENLIFMDSYFNVSLALQSTFGKIDKTIIDKINILYSPDKTKFDAIFSKVKNITLFRAEKLNTMFKNEDEKKFYEYYQNSKYNNLETLINYNLIKVINMNNDTHISWIFNESLTNFLADYVTKLFKKSNNLKE